MKYNRATYKRYEFNVRAESKLNAIIERYKENPDNNLSELIKASLCAHFGIDRDEADEIFVPYHYNRVGDQRNGEQIRNTELDKYIVT